MKISIITVCFNSEKTIEDTILSVLSQDYKNIEYLIIDGGSGDCTLDIIRKYSAQISKVVSESDKGIYDAMNKGIRLATGDVVGILNSDDIFNSSFVLSRVMNRISNSSSRAIFYGDTAIVSRENTALVRRYYSVKNFTKSKLKVGVMPPHPATFIFKDVYNEIGLYRTDFKIAADFEFYVRAAIKNDIPVKNLECHVVNMRDGGVSSSGVNFLKISSGEMARALKDNGVWSHPLITSIRLPLKLWSKVTGRAL